MREKMLFFLLLLSMTILTGCNQAEGVEEGENGEYVFNTEDEILEGSLEAESEPIVGNERKVREVVDGKVRSYLTGEWIDVELGTRRPLAIMLNNRAEALPMSGLAGAEVIYECPVEGRITRWLAFYEDWEDLERIGSVRSCRQYFLDFAQEFDAVYAHYGQAVYVLEDLNSGKYDVLSGGTKGIKHPVGAMYDRISRPGKATEHTLYAFPGGIKKDIEKKGYNMELSEDFSRKFKFAQEGETASYEGYPDAVLLQPGGTGGQNGFGGVKAVFEYHASDQKYYRSTYGNPHTDELTGEQLAVTNVIFQYCDGTVLDAKDYLQFATQSYNNDCIVFTNGKMIEGYWNNPGEPGTPARYYQKDNSEIVLNPGKTFVCIIWNDYAGDVVIQ